MHEKYIKSKGEANEALEKTILIINGTKGKKKLTALVVNKCSRRRYTKSHVTLHEHLTEKEATNSEKGPSLSQGNPPSRGRKTNERLEWSGKGWKVR